MQNWKQLSDKQLVGSRALSVINYVQTCADFLEMYGFAPFNVLYQGRELVLGLKSNVIGVFERDKLIYSLENPTVYYFVEEIELVTDKKIMFQCERPGLVKSTLQSLKLGVDIVGMQYEDSDT